MIRPLLLKHTLLTSRLKIRNLTETDVTERYFNWLSDEEVNQYLEVRFTSQNLSDVKKYVEKMNQSNENLLLGLFEKQKHLHIGNLKIGPINHFHSRAEIDLFIGEKLFWGQGLATEAICKHEFSTHSSSAILPRNHFVSSL